MTMHDLMTTLNTDWPALVGVAVVATILLSGVLIAAQLVGWTRMDVPLILGTVFVADPDRARVVGFFLHLVNGLVFALLYSVTFALMGWATWWSGILFGAFLGLVSLVLFVPLLTGVHPRMGSTRSGPSADTLLEPPGLLGLNYGLGTPAVTLAAHLVYGAALGIVLRQIIGG
jgi:uncharacterized membrane protein YagU involved in acid resistance